MNRKSFIYYGISSQHGLYIVGYHGMVHEYLAKIPLEIVNDACSIKLMSLL
jgi:hypothetical protein